MVALAENNLLEAFFTSIAVFDESPLWVLARFPGLSELLRRLFPRELKKFTKCHPYREGARLFAQRFGWESLIRHEAGLASVDQVFKGIDRWASQFIFSKKPDVVYCYEDCALESFRAAAKTGCKRILDYPVAHWRLVRRILEEENELQPAWSNTLTGLVDSREKLKRKDEELVLSDQIIVASTFSKISLVECPFRIAPVSVIPYGAPASTNTSNEKLAPKDSKLRILFVGGLGQLKGIAYLIKALEIFGRPHALTLIGRRITNDCIPLQQAIQKYHWIPSLSHDQILEEMRHHDIFVFPSLSEGFGMVVTEALSQGLPVITTPHTCGPDVLTDGEDGFIVPIRDSQAIAEKLELLHHDRERLAAMSDAARKKSESLAWADYRRRIVEVVKSTSM